jgi:NIMA-interacting peptidyl-prolyl cis-trans isomerase 1
MQAAFEEAAFALEVGQMKGAVESDSGIHIILR